MRLIAALGVSALIAVTPIRADDPAAPMTRAEAVQMSTRELASRTFAQLAGLFWQSRVEYLLPPSDPPFLGRATFYTKPQVAAPGICGIYEISVSYSPAKPIPDGRPIGDLPSRANFVQTDRVYSFVGTLGATEERTDETEKATEAACDKLTLASHFVYATQDAQRFGGVWKAAHFLESVVRAAGSSQSLPFSLVCKNGDCGDMRRYLAKMTVQAIKVIDGCDDPMEGYGPPNCFVLVLDEPSGKPEQWRIEISGRETPEAVIMKPEMRPVS
jgi:hypothetical protein